MNHLRTRSGRGSPLLGLGRAQRAPRTPGVAYTVVALVLVVLVGALSMTSRESAPPTIAEFAPQAVEQITGGADGSTGAETDESDASTRDERLQVDPMTGQIVDVARVRRCAGDPPRQIEDPQSPPCVPYWSGDNGGATAKGVTRDEIRVASFWGGVILPLERFFNTRFEFYGRKLRLIDTNADGGNCSPSSRQQKAVAADEQWKVFASLFDGVCLSGHYDIALARRGIISTSLDATFPESVMRQHAPYMWSFPMAMDDMQTVFGDWACARFAGRTARYAKGPEALSKRVFGIYTVGMQSEKFVDSSPLRQRLAQCGERSAATFEMTTGVGWPALEADAPQWSSNIVLQMRQSGVTTIFCLCHPGAWQHLGAAASSNGYFPEWLVGTYAYNDFSYNIRLWGPNASQRTQTLGLTTLPRLNRIPLNPAYWAYTEGDDAAAAWGETSLHSYVLSLHYRNLLLLSSGLQMAGPYLTPKTFEAGLQKTVFPNPDHPIKPGKVGFLDGDHSMTDDVAEYWWSETDRGPHNDDAGTICYLDHGDRRSPGGFAAGDEPFFKPPCDSGA